MLLNHTMIEQEQNQAQEPNEVEAQEAIQQAYAYAANLMMHEEKSAGQAKRLLMAKGIDAESAARIVNHIKTQIEEESGNNEQASHDILFGSLWLIGGLFITIFTYTTAGSGGSYVVTWGAIIFGGAQLIRGLVNNQ